MFSKAKRFEPVVPAKNHSKTPKKPETEKEMILIKQMVSNLDVPKPQPCIKTPLKNIGVQSQCNSIPNVKSFATPKPLKSIIVNKTPTITSKKNGPVIMKTKNDAHSEIIKAQEVEIRNKDLTITEYSKQIEEFRKIISLLEKEITEMSKNNYSKINQQLSQLSFTDIKDNVSQECNDVVEYNLLDLKDKIRQLEDRCEKLEEEASNKQLELKSLEDIVTIRDSLCQDLQQKLTDIEAELEETKQRLELVKKHHALALEANESIRREYKTEIETLKFKIEEEKQALLIKCKADQENIKSNYKDIIETIKREITKEKHEAVQQLNQQLIDKEYEMKNKLEQIDETNREKLRLCEIQFEERSRNIQDHCSKQQNKIECLENEIGELKQVQTLAENQKMILKKEINSLKYDNEKLSAEIIKLIKERDEIKEDSKTKLINFENEINKMTVKIEKTLWEKNIFETSLNTTREVVQVLTRRLRESENELEILEDKLQTLSNSNEILKNELNTVQSKLNNTTSERNEYKQALLNMVKSQAVLDMEHKRIMKHNVSLIESLQNVEIEAYRELGSIKTELTEDIELLMKESSSQIKVLRDEVREKDIICKLLKEHADRATAASEQSRDLLAQAESEINRIETENQRLQLQIHDQQSVVVELSLLRQENEELTLTIAKQNSIIDKMKKESEQAQHVPKSPTLMRKMNKIGKENIQNVISPLRERNH